MLSWQEEVLTTFDAYAARQVGSDRYTLIGFDQAALVLNLIPLDNSCTTLEFIDLQEQYCEKGITLVHVWEDVWYTRRKQVLGRIMSMLGLNKKIHARQTRVRSITQPQADAFMEENHLLSSARTRYKLALDHNGSIVAVACFSNLRLMKRQPEYRSAEIVRFASLSGFTVRGGFSKLLKYFISAYQPDDLMSYADRDWSLGKSYEKAGFNLVEITPPAEICVSPTDFTRHFSHRAPEGGDFIKIFNTGNLKYILNV